MLMGSGGCEGEVGGARVSAKVQLVINSTAPWVPLLDHYLGTVNALRY